jgi:DNA polymerase I-like protein with 3'-5' exonuclease and polymerase domains
MTSKKGLSGLPRHVAAPDPSLYWSDNYVVLDFETTSILKGNAVERGNKIILACWSRGERVEHTFGSEYEQGRLVEAVESADFIVAHNAKFELGWLRRCGVDLRKVVVFDTMIGDYVLGGNRLHPSQLNLDRCCERHEIQGKVGPVGWMIRQGWPVELIPRKWLLKYCEQDVRSTEELFGVQRELLWEKELEHVMYARCLLTPALADIEFNGMQLDTEKVLKLEKEEEENYVRLTNALTRFCDGVAPSKAKQLAVYVYDELGFRVPRDYRGKELLTATGEYSVKADVMAALKPKTKRQREFLSLYREWTESNSRLTKYLRKFGDCCREDGGRLHGTFNQCNTRTHRLSSAGAKYRVQFQNFSRAFKPLFCASRSGWVVGEADGAQLEFRVAVHLGRDAVGLHYIIDGDSDIHRFTASVLNDVAEADVSHAQRQAAKPDTFKPLYGGFSGTDKQREYYQAFKDKYTGIAATQERWVHDVLRDKSLRTEWGMLYYWPDTRLTSSGYVTNTTSIYNYPVQAFATAEIIPLAIVAAWHRLSGTEVRIVNTVHDSIIAEFPSELTAMWHTTAEQCLIRDAYRLVQALYGIDLTVPLGAGVVVEDHWGGKDETVYEAPEELWVDAAKEAEML